MYMYQKTKNMYTRQNLDQNVHVHVSISEKIFLIQI